MHTTKKTKATYELPNLLVAKAAVAKLIQRSAWFCFEPYPDDHYRITVKSGEGLDQEDGVVERVVQSSFGQMANLGGPDWWLTSDCTVVSDHE